jgi:hypothetical protein
MPVLLMDIRTQVRGVPHYDCAEMVFGPSEPFALEFTPHNPKDKNSIKARLTTGNLIVGHVAAESCIEIVALRREYATSTLFFSTITIGPAKFGRKGLHVPIQLWCSIKCPNTDTDPYTYTEVTGTDAVVDADAATHTRSQTPPPIPPLTQMQVTDRWRIYDALVASSEKDAKLAQKLGQLACFSLLSTHSHRNAWANLHLLGQPNTVLASDHFKLDFE